MFSFAKTARSLGLLFFVLAAPVGSAVAESCPSSPDVEKLLAAARGQIGVTLHYDPSYVRLSFPGGDVPESRGVCTDVLVRAYRTAAGYDLQKAVNSDMKEAFAAYPKIWGLTRPDSNIDHRRVPNLQTFLTRKGTRLTITKDPADYCPGDLVTQMLPGNLPHIVFVSDRRSRDGTRPLVIHNIGRGTQEEDSLFAFPLTGHYRLPLP